MTVKGINWIYGAIILERWLFMVMTFRQPRLRLPRPHLLTNEGKFVDLFAGLHTHSGQDRKIVWFSATLRCECLKTIEIPSIPEGGRTFLRILVSHPSFLEIAL